MSAVIYNINLEKGSLFSIKCVYREPDVSPGVPGDPIDITGKLVRGSIKAKSTETLELCSLTCPLGDSALGEFFIQCLPTESIKLPTKGASYANTTTFYFDVELYDPLDDEATKRMVMGDVICSPEQTTKET